MKTLHIRFRYILAFAVLFSYASFAWGQESTFYLEDFDGVTPPALPFGWVDTSATWVTSSSVASSGSGGNNLTIAGTQSASVQTPEINLTGLTSGTIEYLARRTSTYPQDSLLVLASVDGGATFSITLLDLGNALPGTDGSYETISMAVPAELLGESDVIIQFTAFGGTTSGSNIRIDDVQVFGEGDATAGNSVFGFSTEASSLDQSTSLVEVPVFLDYEHAESLQGVQLNMTWDVPELIVNALVPGDAVTNTTDWSLTFNNEGTELDVILLGNDGASLSQGVYDPLFLIEFSLPETTSSLEAALTLNSVIGSLAVATGDDAGLILGQQTHTITLDPGDAGFSPDATELDAGQVAVDNTSEVTLTVSNTGNTDLVISDVVNPNALFSLAPTTTTIAPGLSESFIISFTPSFTEFGTQSTTLTFQHNAEGGSTDIVVTGTGTGGRGDASEDGAVDILDLVLGIDYALGVIVPGETQLASTDLFPFGAPDGGIDVRDLTVLSQAVLTGEWPDGLPLPVAPAASSVAGKGANAAIIQPVVSETGSTLYLLSELPVRAVQLTITMDTPLEEPRLPLDLHSDLTAQWVYDAWAGELRMLAVRMDGGVLDAGQHPLLELPGHFADTAMQLTSGLAVIEGPERIDLSWSEAQVTDITEDVPGDEPWIGVPYPNPLVLSSGQSIQVPFTLGDDQEVRAEVFDLLGRRVTVLQDRTFERGDHLFSWNGTDDIGQPVASGIYMLRVSTNVRSLTRTVLVQ